MQGVDQKWTENRSSLQQVNFSPDIYTDKGKISTGRLVFVIAQVYSQSHKFPFMRDRPLIRSPHPILTKFGQVQIKVIYRKNYNQAGSSRLG